MKWIFPLSSCLDVLSDNRFATKCHCVRSNRQKLSTVHAYNPGTLVSIFATSNFVTECLLKVQIFMTICWYHSFRINMGWKMVYYSLDKTKQTYRKCCLPQLRHSSKFRHFSVQRIITKTTWLSTLRKGEQFFCMWLIVLTSYTLL